MSDKEPAVDGLIRLTSTQKVYTGYHIIQCMEAQSMDPSLENLLVTIEFDKKLFPKKHTCDGENISPRIIVERITSPYLACIIFDPDAKQGEFTHWIIWNIRARGERQEIPENIPKEVEVKSPIAAIQGKNSSGKNGYSGPCPPTGETHRYFFNVYGLDHALTLAPGSSRQQLEEAMKGHVKQYGGQAIASYGR
jgi:Raf kinase inhibitor-like YbhB/YbcL family protein